MVNRLSILKENLPFIRASYLASFGIVKEGKPRVIGEMLLVPAAGDMAHAIVGEKAAKEIGKVPLSNDTVKWRTLVTCLSVLKKR